MQVNSNKNLLSRIIRVVFWVFIIISLSCSNVFSKNCERYEAAYHIASDDNSIFTEEVLDEIASCAGIVILNTPLRQDESEQTIKQVIRKLHKKRNDLPVLIYSWVSVWYERGFPRIGWEILADIQNKQEWILERRYDKNNKTIILPDVRSQGYRNWLTDKIVSTVNEVEADGVLIDLAFRSPDILVRKCEKNPSDCIGYKEKMGSLFYELKQKLSFRLLYFNGIFSGEKIVLSDQVILLQLADGAFIEYFGMNPRISSADFDQDIAFFLKELPKFTDKQFLVFGRAPWKTQESEVYAKIKRYTCRLRERFLEYQKNITSCNNNIIDENKWRRYLFAAYKLFSGKNTLYKYQATFQIPTSQGSGALHLIPELTVSLGKPLEQYHIKDNILYTRYFSKGFVVLCRHDANQSTSIDISEPMYTIEGQRVQGIQYLSPGDALILYQEKS